jgi:lipopolysaccharide transport system permease protein
MAETKFEDAINGEPWDLVITPKKSLFTIPVRAVWRYRDLLFMLVRRDIVVLYKQTILGPLWFFIQPILTAVVYIVVFSRIAGLSTGGVPPILFYLSGVIIWNYFQDSFTNTSKTFIENASLFGKVFFPRIILPLSKVIAGLLRFLIQFGLFLIIFFIYALRGIPLHPSFSLVLVPVMVLIMGMLGLGLGVFFTSLTTKYRDLVFLIQFGVQLLMYATPVIYPLSSVPVQYRALLQANPMTAVVEGFRYSFFGRGSFMPGDLLFSFLTSALLLVVGLAVFNYTEKDFMDTV